MSTTDSVPGAGKGPGRGVLGRVRLIVLATVLLVGVVTPSLVVAYGSEARVRLEPVTVGKEGVTQGASQQVVKVDAGDVIYRFWDDTQYLEKKTNNPVALNRAAIVRFSDGDLMFTEPAVVIDEAGETAPATDKVEIDRQDDHGYQTADGAPLIAPYDIVRTAWRQYFYPPHADVYVDDKLVGQTEETQVLIDRAGSATLLTADGKRTRYLGHVVLVADEDHVFDVTAELYQYGDLQLDLTTFGGSDNEMSLLDDDASGVPTPLPTPGESDEVDDETDEPVSSSTPQATSAGPAVTAAPTPSSAPVPIASGSGDKGRGSGDGEGDGDDSGGAGSSTNQPTTPPFDVEKYNEILELLDLIDEYNQSLKEMERAIPSVAFAYVQPQATRITADVTVVDGSRTLVGPVRVEVLDSNGVTMDSVNLSEGRTAITLDGLTPGKDYKLVHSYSFDLEDGNGIVDVEGTSGYEFTTLAVSPRYTVSNVTSSSFALTTALDTAVTGMVAAELTVKKQAGPGLCILGVGSCTTTVGVYSLPGADLSTSAGAKLNVTGLSEDSTYYATLKVTFDNGDVLLFDESNGNASPPVITPTSVRYSDGTLSQSKEGTLLVGYSFTSDSYQVVSSEVLLDDGTLLPAAVPHRLLGVSNPAPGETVMELYPEVDWGAGAQRVTQLSLSGKIRLTVAPISDPTVTHQIDLGLSRYTFYRNGSLLLDLQPGSPKVIAALDLPSRTPADGDVTATLQRARAGSDVWTDYADLTLACEQDAAGEYTTVWSAQYLIPAADAATAADYQYRLAVTRGGTELYWLAQG